MGKMVREVIKIKVCLSHLILLYNTILLFKAVIVRQQQWRQIARINLKYAKENEIFQKSLNGKQFCSLIFFSSIQGKNVACQVLMVEKPDYT